MSSIFKRILHAIQWFFVPLKELKGDWSDVDDDGMSSRYGALFRDASECTMTKKSGTSIKIKGRWKCKYTGKSLQYSDIQVDHIVPKKYAKENKNGIWTEKSFRLFANDMDNLISVDGSTNQSKGAKSIAEWQPDNNQKWYKEQWEKICDRWNIRYPNEDK